MSKLGAQMLVKPFEVCADFKASISLKLVSDDIRVLAANFAKRMFLSTDEITGIWAK